MKLRLQLVFLVLAILVPAFAGFAWITTTNMQNALDSLRDHVESQAQAVRVSMDQEFERREVLLRVLAESPELQRWDLPAFCRLARSVVHGETGSVVLARDGYIIQGTENLDCAPFPGPPRRVGQPITQGAALVTDLFISGKDGQLTMALHLPFDRGGVQYLLSVTLRPAALQERLAQVRLSPGWKVAVMNGGGRVLARVPDPEGWVGKHGSDYAAERDVSERFWREPIQDTRGSLAGHTLDGTPFNAGYSRSSRFGLTVFVEYPLAAALAGAHSTLAEEVIISASLMLFGLLLAAWVANRIAAPADALRLGSEELKAGRAVVLKRYGIPEFDSVAESMEDASTTIRSHEQEMQRRIDRAVEEARASQNRLVQAQKLEIVGRLSGGIAHDFNNVLQTLSTGLALLEQFVREPKAKPLIEAGLRAVDRASRLVQRLLMLGRNLPFDRQPVDLHAQLLGMEVLLSRALAGNVRLHIDFSPGLWRVWTDPDQLEVSLLNLVFNARDALPQGGRITLSAGNALREGKQGVLLSVSDGGKGIPPELLSQVFEPFVTTKPVGRGTGLGLSQVRDFALASEGTVEVESELDVGTSVRLWLPRALEEAQPVAESAEVPVKRAGRVLFVEDDGLISEVVASALQDAGYSVQRFGTADEALRCLRSGERHDVVFSDVVTGGTLSGIELANVLRQEFPRIPVVLASGYAESMRDPPEAIVLTKPYSLQKLVEVLDAAIRAADSNAV
ncbi:MAG: hypothetical protein RLZZ200_936 [Pseudomonadota bacterium]